MNERKEIVRWIIAKVTEVMADLGDEISTAIDVDDLAVVLAEQLDSKLKWESVPEAWRDHLERYDGPVLYAIIKVIIHTHRRWGAK